MISVVCLSKLTSYTSSIRAIQIIGWEIDRQIPIGRLLGDLPERSQLFIRTRLHIDPSKVGRDLLANSRPRD